MGHNGIYATAAECAAKAGELVDGTGWVEANINFWCLHAEGVIHTICRKVFATAAAGYTAMPAGGKGILADAESCLVAIYGIEYNMAGYNRLNAEDMINILRDNFLRDMAILRDQKAQAFVIAGA